MYLGIFGAKMRSSWPPKIVWRLLVYGSVVSDNLGKKIRPIANSAVHVFLPDPLANMRS